MYYSKAEAANLIIDACHKLVSAGLIARTWGNVSARLDANTFLITPSGKGYDSLRPEDLVEVQVNNLEPVSSGVPSSEKGVHGISYLIRKDVNFIIHTHQSFASCLSILGSKQQNSSIIGCDYGLNGSQALINSVGHAVRKHKLTNAFLMANHGAICLGKSYEEAFNTCFELEKTCKEEFIKQCGVSYIENEAAINAFAQNDPKCLTSYIESIDTSNDLFLIKSPYALEISKYKETSYPYIDDFAQIAGISMRNIDSTEELNQALSFDATSFNSDNVSPQASVDMLQLRQCAILNNKGILCISPKDELNALALIIEKQCQAAYFAKHFPKIDPISPENARLDREKYISHYSKLK